MRGNPSLTAAVAVLATVGLPLQACSTVPKMPSAASVPRAAAANAAADSGYPKACTLLTRQDAETALGESVDGDGEFESNTDGGGVCTYSNAADGASVQLQVVNPAVGRSLVQPAEPVSGLGDEALDNHGWLFVRNGKTGLVFQIVKPLGALPAPLDDTVRQLAREVNARL